MCTTIERNEIATLRSETAQHSSRSLICRICFDNESTTDPLIKPCSCSGTVAFVHNGCLERWVRTTSNIRCTICQDEFELIPSGLKRWYQLSLPRPMTEETEDCLEFGCTIAWLIYMTRFAYIGMKHGSRSMFDTIDAAIGTGMLRTLWWFSFWFNFLYYGAMGIILYEKWLIDNTVFSFKDRSRDNKMSIPVERKSLRTSGRSEKLRHRALALK